MHTKKKMGAAAAVVILLGLAAGCGGSGKASTGRVEGAQKRGSRTLNGAGSTFVAPLVDTWVARVKSALGVTLNYSAIGSGGGISAITGRTVDFGASDAPLTAAQAKACHGCVQIPWALGGTAIFFNLPGVHAKLHLDGATLAKIYLGQIKAWNDPGNRESQLRRAASVHADHRRPPIGRLGHDVQPHRLSLARVGHLEGTGR